MDRQKNRQTDTGQKMIRKAHTYRECKPTFDISQAEKFECMTK